MKIEQPIKEIPLHEVDECFQKAHESFLRKDIRLAAEEIRKGTSFMKKEVTSATEEGKKILDKSIKELETLISYSEKGVATSEEKIKSIFENANSSIVRHNQLKASKSITKKK